MRAAELNYHAWSDASTYVLHATVNRIYDSRERRKCMQILHVHVDDDSHSYGFVEPRLNMDFEMLFTDNSH